MVAQLSFSGKLPNQRMKLPWRGGRLKGKESVLMAAAHHAAYARFVRQPQRPMTIRRLLAIIVLGLLGLAVLWEPYTWVLHRSDVIIPAPV